MAFDDMDELIDIQTMMSTDDFTLCLDDGVPAPW